MTGKIIARVREREQAAHQRAALDQKMRAKAWSARVERYIAKLTKPTSPV